METVADHALEEQALRAAMTADAKAWRRHLYGNGDDGEHVIGAGDASKYKKPTQPRKQRSDTLPPEERARRLRIAYDKRNARRRAIRAAARAAKAASAARHPNSGSGRKRTDGQNSAHSALIPRG